MIKSEIFKLASETSSSISKSVIEYMQKKFFHVTYSPLEKTFIVGLLLKIIFFGFCYIFYCYYFFHGVWYLDLIIIVSTSLFILNFVDIQFELLASKFRRDVPKTVRKLRYHLLNTQNVSKALKLTAVSAPKTTRYYITQLSLATDSPNFKGELNKLKNSTQADWLKMLCVVISYCNENGDQEQVISKNLHLITRVVDFINTQQELDNAEILWAQIFTFAGPLIALPFVTRFNSFIFEALEQPDLYQDLKATQIAAAILLCSNISTLLISWYRKNS